jgi:hypothetical protein
MARSLIRTVWLVLLGSLLQWQGALNAAPSEQKAVGPGILSVQVRKMEAQAFERIREFFTGREHTGRRVILRSDPTQRAGVYFIMKFDHKLSRLPEDLTVGVDWIDGANGLKQTFRGPMPADRKRTDTLLLGLTDAPMTSPLAWRVFVLEADGSILGEAKSFLWEKPVH